MNFAFVKFIVGFFAVVIGSAIGLASSASSAWVWSIALISGGMLDLITSRRGWIQR